MNEKIKKVPFLASEHSLPSPPEKTLTVAPTPGLIVLPLSPILPFYPLFYPPIHTPSGKVSLDTFPAPYAFPQSLKDIIILLDELK